MGWLAALLTLVVIVLLIAFYLWSSRRALEKSMNDDKPTNIIREEGQSTPAPISARTPDRVDQPAEPVAVAAAPVAVQAKPKAKKPAAKKPAAKAATSKTAAKSAPAKKPAKAAAKPAAAKAAATTGGQPAKVKKPAKPDDLKQINGIGPVIETKLQTMGVWTYQQIADWKKAERDWVNGALAFKGRIEREEWVKQAKALAKKSAAK